MSIFKRINDVISANINDLIDKVEDPEQMIKQVIREMEENNRKAKEGVADAIAMEKQLAKELENNRMKSKQWLENAEKALREGNEELARSALARKQEHDNICQALEPSWQTAKNTSEQLKTQYRALEAKLEEAKRKRSALGARQKAAEARQQMNKTLNNFETGRQAHTNFSRMEDKILEMETHIEAMDELNDDATQLENDFLAMELNKNVDDELSKLKDKINKTP